MPKISKVIVTNSRALQQKYPNHYNRVTQAIDALIKADVDRGITSRVVALDDRSTMKRFGASPVLDPDDHRANKAAIDAVWAADRPDYLVILGAPDIVAHQNLLNPLYAPGDDDDRFAPSDLPYACDAPFSQDIADFRGPTRVVGRIPDLMGSGDVAYIERVLRIAATYPERPAARYASYFGLTAAVWRKSTALSLQKTFGSAKDLHESPPEGPGWRASQLDPLTHFINCHGGSVDTKFYGQRGRSYPIAMESSRLDRRIKNGTVVAAECCYGAQLFDPAAVPGDMGICNRYLQRGAYAFFGSSTIAYGPSEGNGSADLICQFFIQRVLSGASTGRAALEARIAFALQATHLDPTDLKTLAQFNLMGDPAITVVGRAGHKLNRTKVYQRAFDGRAQEVARDQRRQRLARDGAMLDVAVGAAKKRTATRTSPRIRKVLEAAIRDADLPPGTPVSFGIDDPARKTFGRKVAGTTPSSFHLMQGSVDVRGSERRRHVVVVATLQDGKIVRLRRLHRRG